MDGKETLSKSVSRVSQFLYSKGHIEDEDLPLVTETFRTYSDILWALNPEELSFIISNDEHLLARSDSKRARRHDF